MEHCTHHSNFIPSLFEPSRFVHLSMQILQLEEDDPHHCKNTQPSNNIDWMNKMWRHGFFPFLSEWNQLKVWSLLSLSIFHPDRHGGWFLKTAAERRTETKRGTEKEKGGGCTVPGPVGPVKRKKKTSTQTPLRTVKLFNTTHHNLSKGYEAYAKSKT